MINYVTTHTTKGFTRRLNTRMRKSTDFGTSTMRAVRNTNELCMQLEAVKADALKKQLAASVITPLS